MNKQHRIYSSEEAYRHYILEHHWLFMSLSRMHAMSDDLIRQHLKKNDESLYYFKWQIFKKKLNGTTDNAHKALRDEYMTTRKKVKVKDI